MLLTRLPTKLVGDAKCLNGSETRDALSPVRVFAFARGIPISRHEFANTARDHAPIVMRTGVQRISTVETPRAATWLPGRRHGRSGRKRRFRTRSRLSSG